MISPPGVTIPLPPLPLLPFSLLLFLPSQRLFLLFATESFTFVQAEPADSAPSRTAWSATAERAVQCRSCLPLESRCEGGLQALRHESCPSGLSPGQLTGLRSFPR